MGILVISMKISYIFILLCLFTGNSFSQNFKVFRTYDISTSFSNKTTNLSVGYGEMVSSKSGLPFKITGGLQYNATFLKKGKLDNFSGLKTNNFALSKPIFLSSIGVPIGFEIFSKNLSLGVSKELINLFLSTKKDSTFIKTADYSELRSQTFSNIFSQKSRNSTKTNIYLSYTFSESLTIKIGLSGQRSILRFTENKTDKVSRIGRKELLPFFSLRFNIEK
jgi:hypothetical protein